MTEELNIIKKVPLEGISLVEASAGTGKTYSITKLFLQAILAGNDIREILIVTFTEAATKELRTRVREELYDFEKYLSSRVALQNPPSDEMGSEYNKISAIFAECTVEKQLELVRNALLSVDLAPINTIHGFCQRMLVENAFESRIAFGSELLTDTSELIEEIARNFWRKHFLQISELEKAVLEKINIAALKELVKQFIECRDVKLTNISPIPLQQVKSSLKNMQKKLMQGVAAYDLEELEAELLEYYADIAKNMNKPFGNAYYEETILGCMQSLSAGNYSVGTMMPFCRSAVESKISKAALRKDFALPDAKFFEIGKSLTQITQLNRYLKSAIFEELFRYVHKEFEEIKSRRHILTFNDLIYKLYNVIQSESGSAGVKPLTELIRGKFRIAFVDEFQDTDRYQYYIFNEVFGKSRSHGFFMIGDPKQSIYKFRGADIFSYLKAKRDAQFEYTLLKNYRSEPAMIESVNHIFEFKKALYDDVMGEEGEIDVVAEEGVFVYGNESEEGEGISFKPVLPGGKVIRELITEESSAQALQLVVVEDSNKGYIKKKSAIHLTNEIVELLRQSDQGKAYFQKDGERVGVNPGDIAVLVNNHKQAALIKKSLNSACVPAVIQNCAGIFQSVEACDIKIWLKALQKPIDANIRPLFVTNILKKSFAEIDNSASEYITSVAEELMTLQQQWQELGFSVAFRLFMGKFETLEKILQLPNGERVVTNYFQLADLLHQYELKNGRNIEKMLSYLQSEMEQSPTEDAYLEQLETDRRSVKIMTIHKSKGLEFPIVFCPYLWDNAITSHEKYHEILLVNEKRDSGVVQMLDLKADEEIFSRKIVAGRREILAEHIRLLYVALTRAANRTYLYVGNDKSLGGSALTYVFTDKRTDFLLTLPPAKERGSDKYYGLCLANIAKFAEMHSNVVSIEYCSSYVKPKVHIAKKDNKNQQFRIKVLRKRICQTWGVGSFSALISKAEYHGDPIKRGAGAFGLPSGKKFGTAIHKIFENYYEVGEGIFSDSKLRKYRFEDILKSDRYFKSSDAKLAEERFGIVETMVRAALDANITVDGLSFRLRDVSTADAKPEFSFYHRVGNISPTLLASVFANFATGRVKEFAEEISPLDFILKHGYMNGEIDLFFRHAGRYFVLDWKTNHLGAESADYAPGKIEDNMYKHYYLLQAHIYALAAHLFLKQNMLDYDYDKHFGGFIYVYTRGVDPGGNGIYSHKPARALIENMEKAILSEKERNR